MSRHKISLPLLILCAIEFLVWHSVFVCGEGQIHADFLQKQQSLLSKINAAKYKNSPEKCAFMGGKSEELPSVYDGPPVKPDPPLPPGVCPDFEDLACCTYQQVKTLETQLMFLGQVFAKCEACIENMEKLWCTFTCSPQQASFVSVTAIDNSTGDELVTGCDFAVSPSFAQGAYDSCKWVESSGAPIGSLYKTYQELFGLMGQYSPIRMNFQYVANETSMTAPIVKCEEKCSCQNCAPACTPPDLDLDGVVCTVDIFGTTWKCLTVGLVLGYLGTSLVGGIVMVLFLRRRRGETSSGYTARYSYSYSGDESSDSSVRAEGRATRMWRSYGKFVARYPFVVIGLSLLVTVIVGLNLQLVKVETLPERLWVPPSSRAAQDKSYFDETFGPFFRIEQVIVTVKGAEGVDKALTLPVLNELLTLQEKASAITVMLEDERFGLPELCFRPIPGKGCLINSPLQLWQSNRTKLNAYEPVKYVSDCVTGNLLNETCMDQLGVFVDPNVVFGGFNLTANDYTNATALILTFLLTHKHPEAAKLWEEEFLALLLHTQNSAEYLHVVYSAERSLEDELSRESSADIPTVIISYAVMFVYVAVALGHVTPLPSPRRLWWLRTRVWLAMSGVAVVICALIVSVGLAAVFGVPATLIISEVIPFLVLAIGVDNVFILVNTFDSLERVGNIEERVGDTLARVGTSVVVATLAEGVAFMLGWLTRMPAVQAFALYSALAILVDGILQLSLFVALMSLDARRLQAGRVEVLPCIRLEDSDLARRENSLLLNADKETPTPPGVLPQLVRRFYAPWLFHPVTQTIVVLAFGALTCFGINWIPEVELGLIQQEALPRSSYLVPYFDEMNDYLAVGPPLYLVVKGDYNYSDVEAQDRLCSDIGCDHMSLVNMYDASPYMSHTAFSWLDDYLHFAETKEGKCCMEKDGEQCFGNFTGCTPCFSLDGPKQRPTPEEFFKYLPWFLNSTVDDNCKLTGVGYIPDVVFSKYREPNDSHAIQASRIRSYHTVLKTQDDFIKALKVAYQLADMSNLPVFPYSVFYIFFEQYLYITNVAYLTVGLALAGIFLVTLVLLHNLWISLLVVLTVAMIEVDLVAVMALWGISLNAISVVNMVMAIGISVEFCVHIAFAFNEAEGTKEERATKALVGMGSSVFSGITLTKFVGVIVLAFSSSKIFEVYYFRMFLAIVILGALHGLMFFPVLLSLVGPPARGCLPSLSRSSRY